MALAGRRSLELESSPLARGGCGRRDCAVARDRVAHRGAGLDGPSGSGSAPRPGRARAAPPLRRQLSRPGSPAAAKRRRLRSAADVRIADGARHGGDRAPCGGGPDGACYAIALGTLERRSGSHRNISWCATIALALALAGTARLLPGWLVTWVWLLLGAAAAIASAIRPVLRLHAAGFVAAAAWQSGLLSAAVGLLALPPGRAPESFSEAALASLSAGMLCLPLIARPVAARHDIAGHIGRIALSVIACLGACGLLVFLLRPVAASSGAVDPAAMALIRSAVLAAAAVCVALLRKRTGFPELGWLAYALVVIGGVKLVLEDVPAGRALTLFLAFGLYGTALLWLPRILRAARNGPAAVPDESGTR